MVEEADFGDEMQVLYDRGKLSEVVERCKVHNKQFPLHVYGYYYSGIAHYSQENWKAALQDLRRAGEIDPSWKPTVAEYIDEAELRVAN